MHNFKPGVLYLCLLFIGITDAIAQSFPIDSIQSNGARNKRINLVFVSDGYQSTELNTFVTNVSTINTALMATVPFSEYKSFFNTYIIKVPSTNSGTKHPGTAADESSSGGQPIANPSTYFSTTFDYGSIHRLIVPPSSTPVFNVLSANLPQYTQGFVLVNSPYYGGSGGTFATSTTHSSSAEIAIHEIGHSLASLADEYWAGDGYAGEKANMTKTSNPTTVKWKNWVGIKNVGVYAYGSSGTPAIWYRPHQSCKMQYLGYPFCAVCSEAFVNRFHSLVNMINNYTPTSTSFTLSGTGATAFTVNNLQTTSNTISVKWYLNGSSTPFATGATVSIPYASFATGSNTIKATVFDSTTLSKSYLPAIGYSNSITWTVTKPSAFARLTSFKGEIINNTRVLNWVPEEGVEADSYTVLRSTDGVHYKSIVVVNSLNYNDNSTVNGPSWYKISVTSAGGNFTSDPILLKTPLSSNNVIVDQDANAHKYSFNYGSDNNANVSISVVNAAGVRVLQRNLGKSSHTQRYEFDLNGQPAGIYFFNISIGEEVYTAKLLVL
jgi:hypothetical protein